MLSLQQKIDNKSAKIAVIGLGYVGLPLSLEFIKAGFSVFGIDISKSKINILNNGQSDILDVSEEQIQDAINSQRFTVADNYNILREVDCICITVPTPLNKSKEPDLSYINSSIKELKKYIQKDTLVVLESTTYPGATRELVGNEISKKGFVIGKDIYIAFSPERIDPGNKKYNTSNIPKVIGGLTTKCTKMAASLYGKIVNSIYEVNSLEEAEMVKLLENTFRAVNIGLVNEMALMCDRMGINIWNVIEAAATKPFGYMKFLPGPGLGGHCIPLDPIYLSYKARSFDYYNRFIELATDINGNMPRFVVSKLQNILNEKSKSLKGSNLLLVGITYKENVNDIRESPGLEIIKLLEEFGANINYHDPYVNEYKSESGKLYSSIELSDNIKLNSFSCVVILTAHKIIDFNYIIKNSKLILDTRNVYNGKKNEKLRTL